MAAAVNALRFPVISHVLAIVDDVEGGQAVAGIARNFFGDRPRADGWGQDPKGRTLAGARGGAPKPQRALKRPQIAGYLIAQRRVAAVTSRLILGGGDQVLRYLPVCGS